MSPSYYGLKEREESGYITISINFKQFEMNYFEYISETPAKEFF